MFGGLAKFALGSGVAVSGGEGFQGTLETADFMTADVTVTGSKWQTLGTFTVLAQRSFRVGYGVSSAGANQGYLYVLLEDTTGTELKGKLRITLSSSDERSKVTVFGAETDTLHGDVDDKNKKIPLPEQIGKRFRGTNKVGQDDKILIEFYPDSDCVVSNDDTIIRVPVTEYA